MSGHALVEKYLDCVNRGDADGLAALYAADAVVYEPLSPEPIKGREAIAAVFVAFKRAIPDLEWRPIRPLVEDGKRIAFRSRSDRDQRGPYDHAARSTPADRAHDLARVGDLRDAR